MVLLIVSYTMLVDDVSEELYKMKEKAGVYGRAKLKAETAKIIFWQRY